MARHGPLPRATAPEIAPDAQSWAPFSINRVAAIPTFNIRHAGGCSNARISNLSTTDTASRLRRLHQLRRAGNQLASIYWCALSADRTESPAEMTFFSILFDRPRNRVKAEQAAAPPFFVDLNLDQIVDAVTASWSDYNLKPFFCFSLPCIDTIRYRHDVFRDLENGVVLTPVRSFAQRMRDVRMHLNLTSKLHYQYHQAAWFLHAAELYCDAVKSFAHDLSAVPLIPLPYQIDLTM